MGHEELLGMVVSSGILESCLLFSLLTVFVGMSLFSSPLDPKPSSVVDSG